jgi:GDP-4-dehydro-6-deoxy-D-mannose reductase
MTTSEAERILVTGASGFIGRHLLDALASSTTSSDVHALVRTDPDALAALYPGRVQCHRGDLLERAELERLVAALAPTRVFHLAADSRIAPSWTDPARCLAQNVIGTANLLGALAACARRSSIVLLGSADEHSRIEQMPIGPTSPLAPSSPYGVSKASQKLLCDVYARSSGLDVRRLVLFNVIGPGAATDTAMASFAKQIALIEHGRQEPKLRVGNLAARRVWLDVRDVVQAILAAARAGRAGGTYVLGTPAEPRSVGEVLNVLVSLSSRAAEIDVVVDEARFRAVDVPLISGDREAIERELGWSPEITLETSLRDTLDFWRGVVARCKEAGP